MAKQDRKKVTTELTTPETNSSGVVSTGNTEEWELICSSKTDTWAETTKAMTVTNGVVLRVITTFSNAGVVTACSEALQFIPGAKIGRKDGNTKVIN